MSYLPYPGWIATSNVMHKVFVMGYIAFMRMKLCMQLCSMNGHFSFNIDITADKYC